MCFMPAFKSEPTLRALILPRCEEKEALRSPHHRQIDLSYARFGAVKVAHMTGAVINIS